MSPTPDDIIAGIRNGDYDEDIGRILNAITPRFQVGAIGYRWKINLPDLILDEDQLTVGELEDIERVTGLSWTRCDLPNLLSSAKRWSGFLQVLYMSRAGLNADEASERVRGMNALQVAEGITDTTVVDPPKGSGT
jgi:hypothetical protein